MWYVLHLNDVFMHTKSFLSYINLSWHCDPQWNLCGCLSENYPLLRVTAKQQEMTNCTPPLCSAFTRVVFAVYFSVFAPSSWHRGFLKGLPGRGMTRFVTSLMNMNMAKLRKPPTTSSIHWVSKVWNHLKNLKLEM